jgi:hypothetical protein
MGQTQRQTQGRSRVGGYERPRCAAARSLQQTHPRLGKRLADTARVEGTQSAWSNWHLPKCLPAKCPRGKARVRHNPLKSFGWGGRIRTSAWRNQNPLPYRLATPQGGKAFNTWNAAPLQRREPWRPRAAPVSNQMSKRDRNRSMPTVTLLTWVYSRIASSPCSRPMPLIL